MCCAWCCMSTSLARLQDTTPEAAQRVPSGAELTLCAGPAAGAAAAQPGWASQHPATASATRHASAHLRRPPSLRCAYCLCCCFVVLCPAGHVHAADLSSLDPEQSCAAYWICDSVQGKCFCHSDLAACHLLAFSSWRCCVQTCQLRALRGPSTASWHQLQCPLVQKVQTASIKSLTILPIPDIISSWVCCAQTCQSGALRGLARGQPATGRPTGLPRSLRCSATPPLWPLLLFCICLCMPGIA